MDRLPVSRGAAIALAACGVAAVLPVAQAAADGPESEGGGAEIARREAFFFGQRAFPLRATPPGALVRARAQAARVPRFRGPAGKGGGGGAPAPQAGAADGGAFQPLTPAPGSASWASLGPNPLTGDTSTLTQYTGVSPWAGRVPAIATDPADADTAYAGGADGGVFKTTDAGATWTAASDGLPSLSIGAIAVDPGTASTVYAGTGEANGATDSYFGAGIFKSADGGATWTQPDAGRFAGCHVADVVVGSAGTVLAAIQGAGGSCQDGVFRSQDGGATWQLATSAGCRPYDLERGATPTTWYAAMGGSACPTQGISRSDTDGAPGSFVATNTGIDLSRAGRGAVAVAPSQPTRLYAAFEQTPTSSDHGGAGLYESDDGGATWTALPVDAGFCRTSGDEQCWYDLGLRVDPADADTLYAGGIWLYRYTAGTTPSFARVAAGTGGIHVDQHALAFDAAGRLWAGNDGGVYRSAGGGGSFADLNAGLPLIQHNSGISGALATGLFAGTQDNGLARYATGAGGRAGVFGDAGQTAVAPGNPSLVYALGQNASVYRSTNGGGSFTYVGKPISGDRSLFYAPLAVDPQDGGHVLVGTTRLWQTRDAGANWTPGFDFGALTSAIAVAPADPATVYVATSTGGLWVSRDGGASFANRAGNGLPARRYLSDVGVDPAAPGTAYVTVSGFGSAHLFRTTDFGASWTSISSGLPDAPANAVAIDARQTPDWLYLATDVGVFVSPDAGASWQRETGLPNVVVQDVAIDPAADEVIAATHGRGAYAATTPDAQAAPSPQPTPPAAPTAPQPAPGAAPATAAPLAPSFSKPSRGAFARILLRARVRLTRTGALLVPFSCTTACSLRLRLVIGAHDARRLHLGRHALTLATGRASRRTAGPGTAVLRVPATFRRRLRGHAVALTLRTAATAGSRTLAVRTAFLLRP